MCFITKGCLHLLITHFYPVLTNKALACSFADDHSRMILDKEEGDPDSDYINANYIDVSFSLKKSLKDNLQGSNMHFCTFRCISVFPYVTNFRSNKMSFFLGLQGSEGLRSSSGVQQIYNSGYVENGVATELQ